MKLPVTAVILTYDEELNLPSCLKSLEGWCERIFVVDSGSADQTVSIAQQAGAQVVLHPFETHAKQWNWAMKNLPLVTDWVFTLYADQRIPADLREELLRVLPQTPSEVTGYYLPRKQIFRGKWIRFGGCWPKHILALFRRGSGWNDEKELLDSRFYVHGQTRYLQHALVDQNAKEDAILFWLQKHLRYVELQAKEELERRHRPIPWMIQPSLWGTPDQRILWMRQVWYRSPLYVRSILYFLYRYIFLLGFLDGLRGALFHFLQGLWFRLMVDVRIHELAGKEARTRDRIRSKSST